MLIALLALIVLAVAVKLVILGLRRWRAALELRGDWWQRFDADFREYASRSWQAAREAEKRA
jgi:hypothetical protein